jgi:hypothetical protein
MDPRLIVAHAVKVVLVALLAGLYVTGRSRQCYALVAYLWTALIGNSLTTLWPSVFFEFSFWVRRQALFDVLKLLIGLEVAIRAFRAFPGARATWERLLAILIVFGSSAAFLTFPRHAPYGTYFALQPQIVAATVWLFTITALVVVYYRIPIESWHQAILVGLTPYQLVFTAAVAGMAKLGLEAFPGLSLIDAGAYLLMLGWWAQRAWQKEGPLRVSAETRRLLQLERA